MFRKRNIILEYINNKKCGAAMKCHACNNDVE